MKELNGKELVKGLKSSPYINGIEVYGAIILKNHETPANESKSAISRVITLKVK